MNEHQELAKIHEMARLGQPLPAGTRIKTTQGGIPTGGTHEVNLENANRISEAFSDPRPFWCYAWRDLHDSLLPPDSAPADAQKPEPAKP
jgi:hypothetical protein